MLEYLFYNLFRTPRQPDKDKHVNQTRTLTDGDTASPSLLFLPHRWLIEWRQRINNFREPQSIVYDVCKFSVILFLFFPAISLVARVRISSANYVQKSQRKLKEIKQWGKIYGL